jgi:2-oxoglutarate ferredoxin oxidoreductase subunit alpha
MPTWTEQGDLLFAVHAGHGEFPKIILAPGDINEMISLTKKAFNLAEVYQTPVTVLSDKLLSESVQSITKQQMELALAQHPVDTGKTITTTDQKPYLRYKHSEDGISPRLVPGTPGSFYQANSYEHLEDSHTTEEAVERIAQVDKRNKKIETYLARDFKAPTIYGDLTTSTTVLVCWGSVKGPAFAAQQLLAAQGNESVAIIHFTHVFPLDPAHIAPLFAHHKRYILVENNSTGQLGLILKQTIGVDFKEKLLKYDGRPIFTEEIIAAVQKHSRK